MSTAIHFSSKKKALDKTFFLLLDDFITDFDVHKFASIIAKIKTADSQAIDRKILFEIGRTSYIIWIKILH